SAGRIFCKMEIDHTIIDGASVTVVLNDLAMAYEGRLPNGSGPLYKDYIAFIMSNSANVDIKYWKTYLKGVKPCHFPLLNANVTNKRLNSIQLKFDRFSQLQILCEKTGVTLSNVMQAVWG